MFALTFPVLFFVGGFVGIGVAETITGQYTCMQAGSYELCNNLWNEDMGTGSQTSTYNNASGSWVSWSTIYTWPGNSDEVKSYANVGANDYKGIQLSSVTSAPTIWNWYYESQSSDLRADVSYDIWFGDDPLGDPASSSSSFEIMIWLSEKGGAQPIGSQIATPEVGAITWELWKGPNENWEVYSFVSSDGDIGSFSFDLNDIFTYLTSEHPVPSSQVRMSIISSARYFELMKATAVLLGDRLQYIQLIQAGTEPFEGTGELQVSHYEVEIYF